VLLKNVVASSKIIGVIFPLLAFQDPKARWFSAGAAPDIVLSRYE
jgi:hypothetical protein